MVFKINLLVVILKIIDIDYLHMQEFGYLYPFWLVMNISTEV